MAIPLSSYKTPGVYVQEIRKLPVSIAQVDTAIPVFIGYTQTASATNEITEIFSLNEYVNAFGSSKSETFQVSVDFNSTSGRFEITPSHQAAAGNRYYMYYALQMYFRNGGGRCFVISVGNQTENVSGDSLWNASIEDQLKKKLDPTLIVIPDAVENLDNGGTYQSVMTSALNHCNDPKINNRFVVMDVKQTDQTANQDATDFRVLSGNLDTLKYGAAYYPYLRSTLSYLFEDTSINITDVTIDGAVPANPPAAPAEGEEAAEDTVSPRLRAIAAAAGNTLDTLATVDNDIYNQIKNAIRDHRILMPPASTMAGIYASVDSTRGVYKSPANVGIAGITGPARLVSDEENDGFNVDTTGGKSINLIRSFIGRGTLVWGARTLAGNDAEWRYISVRRFFNTVEESVKRALLPYVFEPNNFNTWKSIQAGISNFLETQWRAGALLGATPQDGFFVNVGMPDTFTEAEMNDGYLVVEIGMSVVRPAEFIVLKFMHKLQTEQQ